MQIPRKYYNPEVHEMFKALCVRQPNADCLIHTAFVDDRGERHAEQTIEMRTKKTPYRGDVLICSSRKPEIVGRISGATIGFVELYDIVPASEMSEADWKAAGIDDEKERELRKTWYGWKFRNPRRIVEMPILGRQGLFDLVMPKGDVTFYPNHLKFDLDLCKELSKKN